MPGSMWPCHGARAQATYTGMDFLTQAPVLASFGADGIAAWQDRLPGTVRESWARGPLGAASANGALLAFGITRTDPSLQEEQAVVLVMNVSAFPASTLVADSFSSRTGIEVVLQSDAGEVVVAVAARVAAEGTIDSSEVRIYDVVAGTVSSFVTYWVSASCLSADGRRLVLVTADSYNSVLVYQVARSSQYRLILNSTSLPGKSSYAATCAVSNAGALWATFPLFWGEATLNQSAVAFWQKLPSEPKLGVQNFPPSSLWLSDPVLPTLEDAPGGGSVYLEGEGLFAFTTWGGAADNATGRTPPTLHLFSEHDPAAPLLQIATPAFDGTCSGSLGPLDMAVDAASNTLRILAAGLNYHENVGSSSGVLYLWHVMMSQR